MPWVWESSFLMAHKHMLGYSMPYDGVEDAIKEWKCNQRYLAAVKYEKQITLLK